MLIINMSQYDTATQLFQRHRANIWQRVQLDHARIQRRLYVFQHCYRRGAIGQRWIHIKQQIKIIRKHISR